MSWYIDEAQKVARLMGMWEINIKICLPSESNTLLAKVVWYLLRNTSSLAFIIVFQIFDCVPIYKFC